MTQVRGVLERVRMKKSTATKQRFNAKTYDRIEFNVYKGEKERIKAYAEYKGESVSTLMNRLLWQEMGEDFIPISPIMWK
jgi:5-formyltetrahydrofolate cyclo-ligase